MTKTLVNATRQHNSLTDNGAVTHSTSLSACLDMFFLAGASRRLSKESIVDIFLKARSSNRNLTYQILLWARDCRGGAGEKRFFRVIAAYCYTNLAEEWSKLAIFVPEFGSWKDLFIIESPDPNKMDFLEHQMLDGESEHANLIAKWFPRKGPWFVAMHKYLNVSPKEFRKKLVDLTNVVETQLCNKEYSDIEYSKVPSVAMNRYRNLFAKRDEARFGLFNEAVLAGKAKVNASVLFPHDLFRAMMEGQDATAVEAQWISLPNYMEGSEERILPVCDVSGSMNGLPMEVSVALGLYIAERNEGIFKDAFVTFSETPTMQYVEGETLKDKFNSIHFADWGMNTNLQATFDLVLDSAVRERLSDSELPTKILIISDMEFDMCTDGRYGETTNLDLIRRKYEDTGYTMPELIFWNLNGRPGNVPASMDDPGIGLVSGFSPAILGAILQGEVATPYDLMMTAVDTAKYRPIGSALNDIG